MKHIVELGKSDRVSIAHFLVSSGRAANLQELPLLPLADGTFAAPTPVTSGCRRFFLVERNDLQLFSRWKNVLVDTSDLPCGLTQALSSFIRSGENQLSIAFVGPVEVKEWLEEWTGSPNSDEAKPPFSVGWAFQLWRWVLTRQADGKSEFISALSPIHILPTSRSTMRRPDAGVFWPTAKDLTAVCSAADVLEVPSLHPGFPEPARQLLLAREMVRQDATFLLDHCALQRCASLPQSHCATLSHYFATNSRHLTASQQEKLRKMPIFACLLPSHKRSAESGTSCIWKSARRAIALRDVSVVPVLDGTDFIRATSDADNPLARLAGFGHPLSQLALLKVVLDEGALATQPEKTLAALIGSIVVHFDEIPGVAQTLRSLRMVPVRGTSERQRLDAIIDPKSKLNVLFSPSEAVFPDKSFEGSLALLRAKNLVNVTLTPAITTDRIARIADSTVTLSERCELSANLLLSLDTEGQSAMPPELPNFPWIAALPPGRSTCGLELFKASECIDHSHKALADRVLPVVPGRVRVRSAALRVWLGWTEVSTEILIRQLLAMVEKPSQVAQFISVVRALAQRQFEDETRDGLKKRLGNLHWLPIGNREKLVNTDRALLTDAQLSPTFETVPAVLLDCAGFLRSMGVQDKPSMDSVLDALRRLSEQVVPPVEEATQLLIYLSKSQNLTDEQRARMFVPTTDGKLAAFESVAFDDGDATWQLGSFSRAHHSISRQLGQKLGLSLASAVMLTFDEGVDEIAQHQDTVDRIKAILREYDGNALTSEMGERC